MQVNIQCTIDTLNKTLLEELRNSLLELGYSPIVKTTTHQGIPYYLISTKDEQLTYVTTLAQFHYFTLKLHFTAIQSVTADYIRVYPKTQIVGRKNKECINTVQYTDVLKGDYSPEEVIAHIKAQTYHK